MTLEKAVSPSAFIGSRFIPDFSSENRKFFHLSNSSHSQVITAYSKFKDNLNFNHYRTLDRTYSDNTFLVRSSVTDIPNRARASINLGDNIRESQSLSKTKYSSTNGAKLHTHNFQTHKPLGCKHSGASNSHSASLNSHSCMREKISSTERLPRTPQEKIAVSQCTTCSREILLETPPQMPRSSGNSSRSSAAKLSERKELKCDSNNRSLHPEQILSRVDIGSVKDTRQHSADARPRESRTCSFFYFIRRRKKSSSSTSPSPDTKDTKSNRQSTRRRLITSCSSGRSGQRSERTSSPPCKDRRPSEQSQASSRLPLTSVSSNPPLSENSPKVPLLTSPSSTKKRPRYTSRSRPKHRRDRRRHRKRADRTDQEDILRHEDLPPHPSLYKKAVSKTSSDPFSKPSINGLNSIISSSNNKENNIINNHSYNNCDAHSRSRKNSKQESSVNLKSAAASSSSGQKQKDSKEDSAQHPRDKSAPSTSKTDLEEESHYQFTTSSSDRQSRRSVRSQSLPSFSGDRFQPDADTRVITDAEDFDFNPTDMRGPINLSMCGCGFLGMYHLGVVSCLSQRGPSFLERVEKVGGASAGALMAAVLVTARDKIEESAEHVHNLAKEIRRKPLGALTPGYTFTRSLRYMLEDILPEDAHETAQGKLYVSLTNADTKKNEMFTDFRSRDELIDALIASCYIPVYAGMKLPMIRGKKYIDGGLSDNLPRFDTGRTITVSPFHGKSDIGPKQGHAVEKKAHFISVHNQDIQISMNNIKKGAHAFFPPKRQTLQEYFEKGRYDASRFLIREGLYEIMHPPQPKAVLYESSV